MKLYYSSLRNSNLPRMNAESRDVQKASFHGLKSQALSASASHASPPAHEAVQDFGFFPKDVQGVIVRWPTL